MPLGYLAMAQCPPVGAWPDPKAMAGGSSLRSMVGDVNQSQLKKSASTTQKTHFIDACDFMLGLRLKAKATTNAHTDQGANECQRNPDPAVQTARGDAAEHGANVATKCQA